MIPALKMADAALSEAYSADEGQKGFMRSFGQGFWDQTIGGVLSELQNIIRHPADALRPVKEAKEIYAELRNPVWKQIFNHPQGPVAGYREAVKARMGQAYSQATRSFDKASAFLERVKRSPELQAYLGGRVTGMLLEMAALKKVNTVVAARAAAAAATPLERAGVTGEFIEAQASHFRSAATIKNLANRLIGFRDKFSHLNDKQFAQMVKFFIRENISPDDNMFFEIKRASMSRGKAIPSFQISRYGFDKNIYTGKKISSPSFNNAMKNFGVRVLNPDEIVVKVKVKDLLEYGFSPQPSPAFHPVNAGSPNLEWIAPHRGAALPVGVVNEH